MAPYADPTAGQFEWFIVNKSPKLDDFIVADEIVACLAVLSSHALDVAADTDEPSIDPPMLAALNRS